MKLIAVTLLSVKNHEKTASFPLIRENQKEELRLPSLIYRSIQKTSLYIM